MVVSFVNMKGGTGKTTLAYISALGLARDSKVLVVDLDPQSNITKAFGIDYKPFHKTITRKNVHEFVQKTGFESVFVIASHFELATIETNYPEKLPYSKVIKYLKGAFDFILIDCPPYLGTLTTTALLSSNYAIIPITPDIFSLEGLNVLTDFIVEHSTEEFEGWFLVPSLIDMRLKLHKSFVETLEENFPERVFKTFIPRRSDIHRVVNFGLDPFEAKNTSSKTRKLLNEFIEEFKKKVRE